MNCDTTIIKQHKSKKMKNVKKLGEPKFSYVSIKGT